MDQQKRWYRKRHVGARYGGVCGRTIDRAVEDGRLPAPKYPFGNKIPYWDGDELDAHDRSLALADARGGRRQPLGYRQRRRRPFNKTPARFG
jgi:hypothetical protein